MVAKQKATMSIMLKIILNPDHANVHDLTFEGNENMYSEFLIRVLHFLFFFGIFSYLHGLIRTYTFIYFREKFQPNLFFT